VTSGPGPDSPGDETSPLPTGAEPTLRPRPSPGPTANRPTSPPPTSPPPTSPPPTSAPPDSSPSSSQAPSSPPPASAPADPNADVVQGSEADQVRAEIAATREELGETVDALSAKLDVKARVEEKKTAAQETVKAKVNEGVDVAKTQAHRLQEAATDEQGKPTPPAIGAAAGAGFLLVLLLLLRRRRRRRKSGSD